MNKMQRITTIAIVALSILGIWSSVTHSQDEGSRRRSPDDRKPRQNLSTQTPHAEMGAEERLVRDVYARLMRYQSAAVKELSKKDKKEANPQDYLTFELRAIHTGAIGEVYNKPVVELITPRDGEVLTITPNHLSKAKSSDPPHASYTAEWTTSVKRNESADSLGNEKKPAVSIGEDPTRPITARTIAEMFARGGERFASVTAYTSYQVTARLNGKQRTYRALVLYHASPGKLGSYQTEEERSAKLASVEILDNVTSEMNTVLKDESPYARSPWEKYSKSTLYLAVIRTIKETKEAGKALVPADAPIGYLPGDDVTPNDKDSQMLRPEDCPPVTVSITVSGVANADKSTIGGLVVLNSDGNNALRQQITVEQAQPTSYAGNVTLTRSSTNVKIFTASSGGSEITFNGTDNKFPNSSLPKSLYVQGAGFSSSMRDITLQVASDGDSPATDQATFTVVWADQPTVVFSGQVSADDDKRSNYINHTVAGWDQLGLQTYTDRFGWGDEAAAVVHPSNFSYPNFEIRLERDYEFHDWIGNVTSTIDQATFNTAIPPGNDTSFPQYRDDTPSQNGTIYDLDAPGLERPTSPQGEIRRTRNNFKAFAVLCNGNLVNCSADFTTGANVPSGALIRSSQVRLYFVRFSMQQIASPSGSSWGIINPPDVTGDNQAAYGTTRLTWNLQ